MGSSSSNSNVHKKSASSSTGPGSVLGAAAARKKSYNNNNNSKEDLNQINRSRSRMEQQHQGKRRRNRTNNHHHQQQQQQRPRIEKKSIPRTKSKRKQTTKLDNDDDNNEDFHINSDDDDDDDSFDLHTEEEEEEEDDDDDDPPKRSGGGRSSLNDSMKKRTSTSSSRLRKKRSRVSSPPLSPLLSPSKKKIKKEHKGQKRKSKTKYDEEESSLDLEEDDSIILSSSSLESFEDEKENVSTFRKGSRRSKRQIKKSASVRKVRRSSRSRKNTSYKEDEVDRIDENDDEDYEIEEEDDDDDEEIEESVSDPVSSVSSPSFVTPKLLHRKSSSIHSSTGTGVHHFKWAEGAECLCKWKDNNWYKARIIQRRNPASFSSTNSVLTIASSDSQANVGTYYIHYADFDRRLDEWVTEDRLAPFVEGGAGGGNQSSKSTERGGRGVNSSCTISLRTSHKRPLHFDEIPSVSHSNEDDLSASDDEDHSVKNIQNIEFGKYDIDAWYFSPFPTTYCDVSKLYFCEYCLRYFEMQHALELHKPTCTCYHPPGENIFRDGELAVYEIDGDKESTYCQNLCLLSKLFLDHKTLYYDVGAFKFYVLTETDKEDNHDHLVGYFSKEKNSIENNNVSCIMSLPPHQRKGYGSFMISFSYELNKRDKIIGGPETPLSDLGMRGYLSYWSYVLLLLLRKQIKNKRKKLSISQMSKITCITQDHIIETFRAMGALKLVNKKHVIVLSASLVDQYLESSRIRLADPRGFLI